VFIPPGTRIGAYEIAEKLGEGGMGVVYAAADTRLKRRVAIKFLPESLATDHDRLARFQREAEALASLNHPNIAAVYGLEDTPSGAAIVMELVQGSDLSSRLRSGALPVAEAVRIARQLAQALEAAHARGVVHRDVKPANIKLQSDGTVKVLDFGLAKMTAPEGIASDSIVATTIASPTTPGMILGTVPYMSPEQLRGEATDKRTDVWAFGCVLYEMLAGTRAFGGVSRADVGAAILGAEPDWSRVPATVPISVRDLLASCLVKDAAHRIGDLAVARFVFDRAAGGPPAGETAVSGPRGRVSPLVAIGAAVAMLIAGGLSTLVFTRREPAAATGSVTRTFASLDTEAPALSGLGNDIAITPDGSTIVYVSNNVLYVRRLDALDATVLATGNPVRSPTISRDGQWVVFADGQMMKKVAMTGGEPFTLARAPGAFRGAVWMPDRTIIYSSFIGLLRVPETGGTPTLFAQPDAAAGESAYLWPYLLPDGRTLLFTVTMSATSAPAKIVAMDVRDGRRRTVLEGGGSSQFVPISGHLIYAVNSNLFAVSFDLDSLRVRGEAVRVVENVPGARFGSNYAVAENGTLVYLHQQGAGSVRTVTWVTRDGKEAPLSLPPRGYAQLRISPDGASAAAYIDDQAQDIWLWPLTTATPTLTRLTFDPAADMYPVWTPDGKRLIYGAQRDGNVFNLWWQPSDGSGEAERLTTPKPLVNGPHMVTPDGQALVYEELGRSTRSRDLLRLDLTAGRTTTPLVRTEFEERMGQVSPDGRWLAYETDSTGESEIHVRPYPDVNAGHWQLTTSGGRHALWSRNGKELFFRARDGSVMSVPVLAGTTWQAGNIVKLFDGPYFTGGTFWPYDVSADGQRFLMIKEPGPDGIPSPRVVVVQNWAKELTRVAPQTR
jgi:Tol biopolymer transport system component/tRNA A-37 threonylcarbamoyl transferase component Bud32